MNITYNTPGSAADALEGLLLSQNGRAPAPLPNADNVTQHYWGLYTERPTPATLLTGSLVPLAGRTWPSSTSHTDPATYMLTEFSGVDGVVVSSVLQWGPATKAGMARHLGCLTSNNNTGSPYCSFELPAAVPIAIGDVVEVPANRMTWRWPFPAGIKVGGGFTNIIAALRGAMRGSSAYLAFYGGAADQTPTAADVLVRDDGAATTAKVFNNADPSMPIGYRWTRSNTGFRRPTQAITQNATKWGIQLQGSIAPRIWGALTSPLSGIGPNAVPDVESITLRIGHV